MRIQATLKKSIVFITHDFQEALRIADRMMIMKDGAVVQTATPTEMILNPANDYVAQFSADVPWSKVLRAGNVAATANGSAEGLAEIDADTALEDVLPQLAANTRGLAVRNSGGDIVGTITAQSVVSALANARESA